MHSSVISCWYPVVLSQVTQMFIWFPRKRATYRRPNSLLEFLRNIFIPFVARLEEEALMDTFRHQHNIVLYQQEQVAVAVGFCFE